MNTKQTAYAISKNGKFLSSLFVTPLGFEATSLTDAYIYSVEQIARDIAQKQGAIVIEVYKPNAPFGDWKILKA